MKRYLLITVVIALIGVLIFSGCAAPAPKPAPAPAPAPAPLPKPLPEKLSLASYRVGEAYYEMSVGLAKVASERSPIKVIVQPYAGPSAFLPPFQKGEVDMLGMGLNYASWAYYKGPGFPEAYKNVRLVFRGNIMPNTPLVVRRDSGIKTVADLRGKRVASQYGPLYMAHAWVEVWLASEGLTWSDVKEVPVPGLNEGLEAFREGRVDTSYSAVPNLPAVMDMDAAFGVRFLPYGDNPMGMETMKKLELAGGSDVTTIQPLGVLKEPMRTVVQFTALLASSGLSEEAVYTIAKAIWENYKELQPIHSWLAGWNQERMFTATPPVPYHPGAIRLFKEKGLWTDKVDKLQKELLAR